ncbi:MAG: tetratricopeptide repeat protein [Balneolaceae bacterium]
MKYKFLFFFWLVFSCSGTVTYANVIFYSNTFFTLSDTTEVQALLEKGEQANNTGEYDLAKGLIHKADSLSKVLGYLKGEEKAVSFLADIYINEGNYPQALEILLEAVNTYPESSELAQYHNLLGAAYKNVSETDKAILSFETALKYTDRMPPQRRDRLNAGIKHNLAVIYQNLGQYNKAFENYLTAIEYAEAANDTIMLTIAYNNLGLAYNNTEEYDKAIYYFEKSLEFAELKNSKLDIYRAVLNMANTFGNTKRYDEALSSYELAEKLHNELRPNIPPVIILHNRGRTLGKMKQYEEAEILLKESLALSDQMNIPEGMYYNHFILGTIYQEQKRSEESIPHFEKAVDLAINSTNPDLIEESREKLYKAYSQANRYEDAFRTLQSHKAFTDSITDIEKEKELANLQSRLELNRQNELNQLLNEKQVQQEGQLKAQLILIIAAVVIIILIVVILLIMRKTAKEKEVILGQLKAQKQKLEELNLTKDKLFTIIAHDLRTPLSSMQGVLYLIKERAISEKDMLKLVKELEISVQKNVNVMEDLLTWAKGQLTGVKLKFKSVRLKPLIEEIIGSQKFMAEKKGITITQKIAKNEVIKADSNALRLVIRNLLSNAIKFTNENGKIKINSEVKNGNILLSVSDNGIGIPDNESDKVFDSQLWSRDGTKNEKGSGFGLGLSKEFVQRMDGKIWFESKVGKGTTFYVELPTSGDVEK